ncbi:acyltransferase-domain-containing protein [Amylostereum chailletii]|nr:acyltransferase-domain-containing protein [Amylostereum chailletii]
MTKFLSAATVTAIGLTCKSVLNLGLCSMAVRGLPTLMDALQSTERERGRGVVTVCNHISVLDDPLTWGIMPARSYWNTRTTRWSLGASDIMFTNPILSCFFRRGQVLETFRGKGICQPAVDAAIAKLSKGDWIHLFGEGKIRQPSTYEHKSGIAKLLRFKWGIGRILIETPRPPIIIPMWITGFDKLMPEGRRFPFNFLPRFGAKLSVTFGEPIPPEHILAALRRKTGLPRDLPHKSDSWIAQPDSPTELDEYTSRDIRIEVTSVVQQAVEKLGREVSGDMLGQTP